VQCGTLCRRKKERWRKKERRTDLKEGRSTKQYSELFYRSYFRQTVENSEFIATNPRSGKPGYIP
jgi:hypothetical protein